MKTKKQKTKKEKKNLFMGIFIIIILVLSTVGFLATMNKDEREEYKGHTLVKSNEGWALYLEDTTLLLSYHPSELANLTIPAFISLEELSTAEKIYISLDPNQNLYQPLRDFSQIKMSQNLIPACYEELAGCENKPIKNCSDATPQNNVVIFKTGLNETNINQDPNCLTIQGKNTLELTKAVDKLLLTILGL